MLSWREQNAARQSHRRDLNEAFERAPVGVVSPPKRYTCECGDPCCESTVCVGMSEYESVRAYGNHFLIATNHENPEVEHVVTENKRFAIVATFVGQASKVALRTDPRRLYVGDKLPRLECT